MKAATDPPAESAPTGQPSAYNLLRDPVIWLLFVGALLLRVGYNLALHPDGHPPLSFVIDEREYFGAAHTFAEGRGFQFYDTFLWVRPPLYVALLGVVLGAMGTSYSYQPVLALQSLMSALSLLPLGRIASLVAAEGRSRVAARWVVGLGALYLPFTLFAGLLLSETLFVLLFACALLALVRCRQALMEGHVRGSVQLGALAGLLLGLATLTRATALAFVPLAALWLLLALPAPYKKAGWRSASLLVGVFVLALLPWTVRNYAAYGRFVPVDTTSGYNLWLGSIGVRDEERLQAELRTVPNQADRQSYAYARAWENIVSDPAAFVGKGLKESLDLWRPSLSAEENATKGYPSGRVPAWHLVSLLVLDNGLYVAILLLAIVGLALSPPSSAKWLTGLWALLWVGMSFVFFAVTRFRLPVVAALLPWAGAGVSLCRQPAAWRALTWRVRLTSLAGIMAVILVVVANVPLENTLNGIAAWNRQEPYREGERLLIDFGGGGTSLLGDDRRDAAIANYRKADMSIADTRYGLAAAMLQKGQTKEALVILRPDEPDDRYEPPILRGQAARMIGDLSTAHSFFNQRVVQVAGDSALRWAWDHLNVSPVDRIELGSGLDVGYVRGFYGPEKDAGGVSYRWSSDSAEWRDVYDDNGPKRAGYLLTDQCGLLTWSGWRPSTLPATHVTLTTLALIPDTKRALRDVQPFNLANTPAWQDAQFRPGTYLFPVELTANAFIGSGADPRLLGVRVSRIGPCTP